MVKCNGIADTIQIKTTDGLNHHLTTNEPLWTDTGWKRADEIQPGDHLRSIRVDTTGHRGRRRLPHGHSYLLGFLIGDGAVSSTGTTFSCADASLLSRLHEYGDQLGFGIKKIQGDNVDYSTSGLTSVLKDHNYGIHGHTAKDKRVPNAIFTASPKDIAAFLAGYWDADGTALKKTACLSFSSCNLDLLKDVKSLFTKTTPACVGHIREDKAVNAYNLFFYGRDALEAFWVMSPWLSSDKAERIKVAWHKRYQGSPWLSPKVTRHRYNKRLLRGDGFEKECRATQNSYGIPAPTIIRVLKKHSVGEYEILNDWFTPAGEAPAIGFSGQQDYYRPAIVYRLCAVLDYLDQQEAADEIRELANPKYWWNMVVAVEAGGKQDTWALSCPGDETFICEDTVAHNTTWAIAVVLWFLGQNRNLRIKIVCGNDTHAAKRLAEIKSHIENDKFYHLVFPGVKLDKKRKNDSMTLNLERDVHSRDASVEAKGILSDATGDRADIILFDDICNFKNSIHEPATRPKVLQKVRGDWLNTLNPRDGRVIDIFTPWHEEDANAVLKREMAGKWAYKRYAHGKPNNPYYSIFPELFPEEWLRNKRFEVGSLEYARAYLCKAMSRDIQLVRPEWLKLYTQHDITPALLNRATVVVSIDPTGSKGSNNIKSKDPDYIGVTVFLIDQEPDAEDNFKVQRAKAPFRIYVVESYQLRLTTAQAAQHAVDLYTRWRPEVLLVEAQGAQSLHEWIYERAPHINVQPIAATISKQARLESVTPWMEEPRELILFHPRSIDPTPKAMDIQLHGPIPAHAESLRDLRRQLLDFPTTHDDILDSFTQGLRFIRQWIIPYENEGGDEDNDQRMPEVDVNVTFIG
jgi:hypothetical protein